MDDIKKSKNETEMVDGTSEAQSEIERKKKRLKVIITTVAVSTIVALITIGIIKVTSNEEDDVTRYLRVTGKSYSSRLLKDDGVFLDVSGDEINTAMFKKFKDKSEAVGLIVEPTNYTYASIYKTIDCIKDLVAKGGVTLPVFYNVDKYQPNPMTQRANVLLADMFVTKLNANGIYAGICGSPENIASFREIFPNYTDSHIYEYFYTMVLTEKKKKNMNLSSVNIVMDKNEGTSSVDFEGTILEGKYNNSSKFVLDKGYIVSKGDTLAAIAAQFGMKVSDLAEYNGIANPDRISIGQEIIIPNSFANKKGIEADSFETYVVAAGDTLSDIADRYNVTVSSICEYSGISNPNKIYPGQELNIPVYSDDKENDEANLEETEVITEEDTSVPTYYEDEATTIENQNISPLIRGIDISRNQAPGALNWDEISNHVDFAIIRMFSDADGGRALHMDDSVEAHIAGCHKSGIPIPGLYWATTTMGSKEIVEDAYYIIEELTGIHYGDYGKEIQHSPRKLDLNENDSPIIYMDIEHDDFNRLKKKYGLDHMIEQIIKVSDLIEECTGFQTGVYINGSDYSGKFRNAMREYQLQKRAQGSDFSIWLTYGITYKTEMTPEEVGNSTLVVPDDEVSIYQYTERGRVPGYNGEIDIDKASSKILEKNQSKQKTNKSAKQKKLN